MLERITQWRQRSLDVTAVLAALLLVSRFRPELPFNGNNLILASVLWAVGLSLTGHYKRGGPVSPFAGAAKLIFDHVLLSGIWIGALVLWGSGPGLGTALAFSTATAILLLLARVRLGNLRSLRYDPWALTTLGTDLLFGAIIVVAVNGLWWSLPTPASFLYSLLAGHLLVFTISAFAARPVVAWTFGQGLLVGLMLGADSALGWPHTTWQIALGTGLIPAFAKGLRIGLSRLIGPPPDQAEYWRRLALGAAVFALLHPLCSAQMMGASDAKVYAEAMQDFLEQVRAGIFPVFISQTEIAPFGSVFPFRMAFYHFNFGALLDLLTLRSLNAYAIQHLTLLISAAAGAFGLYTLLKRLAPALPWEAAALSALYLASPVWLSALYGLDMYFTAMALPWLPAVFYSVLRTFQPNRKWRSFLLLGIALAATWLAHPPVGLWASACAALSQLVRLALLGRNIRAHDLGQLSIAGVSCAVLSAGLFVSLADVRIAGELVDPSVPVLKSIASVVPQIFQPVSANANKLSDMHLGYGWHLLLAAGILFRPKGAAALPHFVMAILSLGLLVLIYPVPVLTPMLWRILPWEVTNITNIWPMQRIYPVVVTIAALVALGSLRSVVLSNSPRIRALLLVPLCFWSAFEATKFLRRARDHTSPIEATRIISKVENSPLLPSWTAYTPRLPSIPLIGHVRDPVLLNRLLDPQTNREVVDNARAAAETPVAVVEIGARFLSPGVMRLTRGFTLEPGWRYQLQLAFTDPRTAGSLQIRPLNEEPPRFFREIAFTAAQSTGIANLHVWTSEPSAVAVEMLFRPENPADADHAAAVFLKSRLIPYRSDSLPIKVTSLAPYIATVDHPTPSLLETHRFYARGYRATVNGTEVPVTESPDHRVLLPLGAGHNEIRLDYVGPPSVQAAFWLSGLAWVALAGFGAWISIQTRLARRPGL